MSKSHRMGRNPFAAKTEAPTQARASQRTDASPLSRAVEFLFIDVPAECVVQAFQVFMLVRSIRTRIAGVSG